MLAVIAAILFLIAAVLVVVATHFGSLEAVALILTLAAAALVAFAISSKVPQRYR